MIARWLLLALFGAAALGASAPPDAAAQARRPGLGPAAGIAPDTMTTDFVTRGVRVILRRNAANDVVAANLYLLGGVRQVTADTAGI